MVSRHFWLALAVAGALSGFSNPSSSDDLVSNAEPLRFQRLMASGSTVSPDQTIGAIKDMVQDNLGYMWFAAEFGLARYDSHKFTFYYYDPNNPRSISSSYVSALAVDKDGVL